MLARVDFSDRAPFIRSKPARPIFGPNAHRSCNGKNIPGKDNCSLKIQGIIRLHRRASSLPRLVHKGSNYGKYVSIRKSSSEKRAIGTLRRNRPRLITTMSFITLSRGRVESAELLCERKCIGVKKRNGGPLHIRNSSANWYAKE